VRDRLGLKSGDKVVFDFRGDSVYLVVERQKSLGELRGSLPANRRYPGKEGEREAARERAAGRGLNDSLA
jgi:bifunctional DNA-binding transcriptional regulator/antitoxin component of YhaV-PrlF toxin-antitoxin module